jgi:hypothetical protein
MGNVLSKMRVNMKTALNRVKKRLHRDTRVEQIYEEIHQEDPTVEMSRSTIVI